MAEKLSNIIQVDGTDYEVHAVDSGKLGGVEAELYAKKDDIPTLIVVNKTSTDTQDSVFAVTNLIEDGDKAHRITPTYTSLPTITYVDKKQAQLVSGTNIKTINGNSILGSGNLTISGGSGGVSDVASKINVAMDNGVTEEATITIKSSDPSGGNVGDIWFKY